MKPCEARFAEYFQAIHGCMPFPWQQRLLTEVVTANAWPSTLSLPTGAGKTAILDIALFALACGVATGRRIVLVVDRRIVVDDAYRRAEKIRQALTAAPGDGIIADVRGTLLELGGTTPVATALLRGGIYREDNWARDPLQPVLVCSTVDQVGSRMLHQGYGVSPHTRPIHAGLLANDCLIVLDEAHTSEPFRQTLEWIKKYRRVAVCPIQTPFTAIAMTATPRTGEQPFTVDATDRAHPILGRRLNVRKRLSMTMAQQAKDAGLIEQITEQTIAHLAPGRTLLVVANRVKTARAIAEALKQQRAHKKEPLSIEEPILLTGRSRPLERDRLLAPHRVDATNRLFAGRDRAAFATANPLVVVATQCVEVGADLDADVLISEVCPLDSLRQRLGRLDRLGDYGDSKAVLVAPADIDDEKREDPIYGPAPRALWQWLRSKDAELDAGIGGWDTLLAAVDAASLQTMIPTPLDAPVMFPAYLDLWSQTSPAPAVTPDPAIFLHGPARGTPEVQLVWRADLPTDAPSRWADIVAECPPVIGEALSVPIYQARQWLAGDAASAAEGSDLESEASASPSGNRDASDSIQPFLRWRGRDDSTLCQDITVLRPGDTIVLPCAAGGCDAWGWRPQKTTAPEPVVDLADEARWQAQRAPIIRIAEGMPDSLRTIFGSLPSTHTDDVLGTIDEQVRAILHDLDTATIEPPHLRAALAAIQADTATRRGGIEVLPHPSGAGWILRGKRRMRGYATELNGEDDTASRLARRVTLKAHVADVVRQTEIFAQAHVSSLQAELARAAEWHDLGKADPRFQAMLNGGDRFRAPRGELLAKSDRMPLSARENDDVMRSSGYPKGARHELLSVRLAETILHASESDARDSDLVLHLVASHHGRCRPFAPAVEDPRPRLVTLTLDGQAVSASSDGQVDGMGLEHIAGGIAERFWRSIRKYGWWGLAYLEVCLRLADWKASAQAERIPDQTTGGAA
jgi:CRISPR-associated endonuclease/helicase Cas3